MGEVHLRHDRWLGREVAVKTLTQERTLSATARARFLREARVQGQLQHPAIVPVYDVGIDGEGHEYFTMKRVTGRTLEDVLASGESPRSRLLGLFRQVCLAIDYAHARGVVHRDLKPGNVMIGDFGEVYVLDWGLAKLLEPGSSIDMGADGWRHTLSGQIIGTPGYMAPEQITLANDVDERADVYALGAILFELLAGEPLHGRGTVAEVLQSTESGRPSRPSERAPDTDVPPELDALCASATTLDPAARRVSARDIATAIERFVEGDRDLAARRTLAVKHAEAAAASAARALAGGADAIESRARALKEAGRALSLDPENIAGSATLVRLIAEPPATLPDEVRAELDRADLEAMRLRNRKGLGMMIVFLAIVISVSLFGARSWVLLGAVLLPLVASLAVSVGVLVSRDLTTAQFEKRTDWVVGLGLAAVSCVAVVGTSNLCVPLLALLFVMGAAGAARPRRRARYMAMGLAAFLVPFLLEWSGLARAVLPGLRFVPGGILIPVASTELPELPVRFVLLATTCASIFAPSLTVFPVMDAAASLRTQSLLHAWHLRHLAPGEPSHAGPGAPERQPASPRASRAEAAD